MVRIGIAALVLALLGADGVPDADREKPGQGLPPMSDSPGPSLALVDLQKALEECRYFKEQMAALKADIAAADERMKRKVEKAERLAKRQEDPTTESAQGQTVSHDNMPHSAELRKEIYAQRREFLFREARIYSMVRHKLSKYIEDYCRENGIGIVMKVEDEKMDPSEPGSVLRATQRRLVWHGPEIRDITEDVIARFDADIDEAGAFDKASSISP